MKKTITLIMFVSFISIMPGFSKSNIGYLNLKIGDKKSNIEKQISKDQIVNGDWEKEGEGWTCGEVNLNGKRVFVYFSPRDELFLIIVNMGLVSSDVYNTLCDSMTKKYGIPYTTYGTDTMWLFDDQKYSVSLCYQVDGSFAGAIVSYENRVINNEHTKFSQKGKLDFDSF